MSGAKKKQKLSHHTAAPTLHHHHSLPPKPTLSVSVSSYYTETSIDLNHKSDRVDLPQKKHKSKHNKHKSKANSNSNSNDILSSNQQQQHQGLEGDDVSNAYISSSSSTTVSSSVSKTTTTTATVSSSSLKSQSSSLPQKPNVSTHKQTNDRKSFVSLNLKLPSNPKKTKGTIIKIPSNHPVTSIVKPSNSPSPTRLITKPHLLNQTYADTESNVKNMLLSFKKKPQDTRALSNRFRRSDDKDSEELKTFQQGLYSRVEREAVDRCIKQYLEMHDVPISELTLLFHREHVGVKRNSDNNEDEYSYSNLLRFVQERSGVNRTRDSLHEFVKRHYREDRDFVGHVWTEEEDARLEELIAIHGKKWKHIENLMGRIGCKVKNKNNYGNLYLNTVD